MQTEFNEIYSQLECWLQSESGAYLLQQQLPLLDQRLQDTVGHRLVQLSLGETVDFISNGPQAEKIIVNPGVNSQAQLVSELDQLPFAAESVDVLVLHHAIEFAANPHQLLREASRVLAHRGEILILSFNPWSLVGAYQGLAGLLGRQPWLHSKPLSKHRMKDWLNLLGFEVETLKHGYALPPKGEGRIRRTMESLDAFAMRNNWVIGGFYLMHARKHVSAMTPDRLRWDKSVRKRLIGLNPKPVPSPFDGDVAA